MIIHKAIVTVLGMGYAPLAPGTFGTLAGVIAMSALLLLDIPVSTPVLLVAIAVLAAIGIFSTDMIIPAWGDDPSRVVIDELVGYLIALLWIPINWKTIVIAFVLFRFFDILKPLGVRWIDNNVKGGLGVMMDDVLAGIYACIALHAIIYLAPNVGA